MNGAASSLYPKEAVKLAADAAGYPAVSDEVAQNIASQLEYTLRELVQVSGTVASQHTHTHRKARSSKQRSQQTGDSGVQWQTLSERHRETAKVQIHFHKHPIAIHRFSAQFPNVHLQQPNHRLKTSGI